MQPSIRSGTRRLEAPPPRVWPAPLAILAVARSFVPALAAFVVCAAAPVFAADEIHWTITGPASITFDWRGPETAIAFGETPAYGRSSAAYTPSPLPFSSAGPFREARLTGLSPNTLYHYDLGRGDHTFRTAPARGSSDFVICVEGDIGDSTSYPAGVPGVQHLIATQLPRFALLVGDLTYANDHGQSHVDQHYNDVMPWSEDAAYMPAWGNHEWDSSGDDFRNYKGRFDLPNPRSAVGAPTAGGPGEDWYWFDYGNVRFIAYPEPFSGAWQAWAASAESLMTEVDADPQIAFIVTMGHRPAYSSGHHPGAADLRAILDALGAGHPKYQLDLCGHSHGYERTHPQHGVVHTTVGTGGASLEEESGSCPWLGGCPAPAYTAYRAFHLGTLRLHFTASAIEGTALCGPPTANADISCVPGDALDTFTIVPGSTKGQVPVIDCPPPHTAVEGVPVAFDVIASDPDGQPVTIVANGLPRGAKFDGTRFEWTPDSTQAGGYTVNFQASDGVEASECGVPIEVRDATVLLPARVAFAPPRPNPAPGAMTLAFELPAAARVSVTLYGLDGRFVARIANDTYGPGHHELQWNGRGDDGRRTGSGVYYLRFEAGGVVMARRVTLVR